MVDIIHELFCSIYAAKQQTFYLKKFVMRQTYHLFLNEKMYEEPSGCKAPLAFPSCSDSISPTYSKRNDPFLKDEVATTPHP